MNDQGVSGGGLSSQRLSVATWNMDHWKQNAQTRRDAWTHLTKRSIADVALLQECVPPRDLPRGRIVYREIGGSRPWGSAVVAFDPNMILEEIGSVRTRYSSTRFTMLGTYPGATIVAQAHVPGVGPITFVSVYGLINVYAQTTMLRIVADLIPLFDSPAGERVVLGGDMNVTTATTTPELRRYEAVLKAVESLGLVNLADVAAQRPPQLENCPCGAQSCHHLRTFGRDPGCQLDWLFATPNLAHHCQAIRVEDHLTATFSDHVPVVAEFLVPEGIPEQEWDPETFVQLLAARHGTPTSRIAEEIVVWAQRKHHYLREVYPHASLDRLPTSRGTDPELWVQLDFKYPSSLGWTVSLTATGRVVVQFQHMRMPPFDTAAGKERLLRALTTIPGLTLDERLNGRPSFPLTTLAPPNSLGAFLSILDETIDRMVDAHRTGVMESASASKAAPSV